MQPPGRSYGGGDTSRKLSGNVKRGPLPPASSPPEGYLGSCNGLVDSSFFDFFKRLLGFLAPM